MYSRLEYDAEVNSNIPHFNSYKILKYRFTIQYKNTDPRSCLLFVTNIETEEEIILSIEDMLPTVIRTKLDNLIWDWEEEVIELRQNRERRIRRYERKIEREQKIN